MGYATASDLATSTDLRQAVSIHFSSNCYPPIPQIWVEQAVVAIHECTLGFNEELVYLPEGVTTRDGSTTASAGFIVDSLRLEAFVDVLRGEDN